VDRAVSGTRSLIGITSSAQRGLAMWLFNRLALRRAGARAVRITADRPFPIERLDGLVVGGGDDIDAALYGGTTEPTTRIDPERDRLELRALEWADRLGLPVLGICRGSQMINVHRGGSLHGDIYTTYPGARRLRTPLPRKTVAIEQGSRLFAVLGLARCQVNALHHQSVDRLGQGLRAVARDEAGIVQAVEAAGPGFLLGVQWHPEFLVADPHHQGLFRALVQAARERSAPAAKRGGAGLEAADAVP
jgi:putative glutamine amidotransferase